MKSKRNSQQFNGNTDVVSAVLSYVKSKGLVAKQITVGWSIRLRHRGKERPVFQLQLYPPKQRDVVILLRPLRTWVAPRLVQEFRGRLDSVFRTDQAYDSLPSIPFSKLRDDHGFRFFCDTMDWFFSSVA